MKKNNATKEDLFFLLIPPYTDFFSSSISPSETKKDFPPDQFFIRRLTEQGCPLDLTPYSLIPPQHSTPPSLFLSRTRSDMHIYYTLWNSHTTCKTCKQVNLSAEYRQMKPKLKIE